MIYLAGAYPYNHEESYERAMHVTATLLTSVTLDGEITGRNS